MKKTFFAALLLASAVTATHAFAFTKADEIGEPGTPALADRTLQVTSNTRYLNVISGETVELDVNGRAVTWHFDGLAASVNLPDIVPGAPDVPIWVSRSTGAWPLD